MTPLALSPMCLTCKMPVDRAYQVAKLGALTVVVFECHGQRESLRIPDEVIDDMVDLDDLVMVAFEPPELLAAGW